jgi:hypothetical protein|tara:strand:- start:564 stop:995 length:432 start_codon:yes stop_codon:yes gene_type:complete
MGYFQKEWLVYFYDDETKNRYSKYLWWLKKGFTHCGALSYSAKHNLWIHLEYTHVGIRMSYLDEKEIEDIFFYLSDHKILICPIKDEWQFFRIKDLTCVAFVMRLIGFFKWYILTPYQLYCALLKAGYKPFNVKKENHGKKNS